MQYMSQKSWSVFFLMLIVHCTHKKYGSKWKIKIAKQQKQHLHYPKYPDPSKSAYFENPDPCYTGSNPSIGGSLGILRVCNISAANETQIQKNLGFTPPPRMKNYHQDYDINPYKPSFLPLEKTDPTASCKVLYLYFLGPYSLKDIYLGGGLKMVPDMRKKTHIKNKNYQSIGPPKKNDP